ncbi:NAD(P)H-hydrate dehydratase [Candidatus Parcubacteria bacterium]|nr:MAG: NAD(P)H-hydrate dehydratase [Candidatus Parcubacteria bacterium]
MEEFDPTLLKQLYIPRSESHKGQNGKLLIIGGSHLFHSASLWALEIASKIVDMVFYSSVPENNEIVQKSKEQFKNGIVVKRSEIEHYIQEADCILIGPGMVRTNEKLSTDYYRKNLKEVEEIEHEGIQTYHITKYLLKQFPQKRYVLDAGALQMTNPAWLKNLKEIPILTPHKKEFQNLFGLEPNPENAEKIAKEYNCTTLLKGEKDIICSPHKCTTTKGGNAGMTKGGTGDVLAGIVAALYCKNDVFLSSTCASYINKKAGDELFSRVGPYFNASDLTLQIPQTMKHLILDKASF